MLKFPLSLGLFNCFRLRLSRSPPPEIYLTTADEEARILKIESLEDLPAIPVYNLDGAFCRPLRRSSSTRREQVVEEPEVTEEEEEEEEDEEKKEDEEDEEAHQLRRKLSVPLLHRRRAYPIPELDMVAGRKPTSTWQAVAGKVVSANRIRRGLGKEVRIEDFKVEELGSRGGKSIFGPVSVFNGAASFRVRKPLKGITVTVTFAGVTEVDGHFVSFLSEKLDVFSGGESGGGATLKKWCYVLGGGC